MIIDNRLFNLVKSTLSKDILFIERFRNQKKNQTSKYLFLKKQKVN